MRESLEDLEKVLRRMDVGYSADAICDLRDVVRELIKMMDVALPVDKGDDA